MENLQNQIKYKQIRASSSQLNIKSNYKNEDLVFLINSLNYDIKSFCQSIKKCIYEGKQNIYNGKIPSKKILDSIEQYLNDFINKAKDIFKKMKYTQKINIIQQDINDNQNNSNLFLDDLSNKMKFSRDNLLLNNNFNNISSDKTNFMDKNFEDEAFYIPSLCNNTSTSIKINNYFDNNNNDLSGNNNLNINDINKNSHKYKKVNVYSINNNKINEQNHNYGTNSNIHIYKKCYNNNPNNCSEPKIMFHNYIQYNNNPNKKKKTKSVHELRKKNINE